MSFKFRTGTLLWLTLVVAIAMTSILLIVNDRARHRRELLAQQVIQENLTQQTLQATLKQAYLNRELGLFENLEDPVEPRIRFLRLPNSFGKMQMHGLPFTWRWRMVVPDIRELEVCWASEQIPADGLEIPGEHLHVVRPDLKATAGAAGLLHVNDTQPIDLLKPVEVLLIARLQRDGEQCKLGIHFELQNLGEGNRIYRGTFGPIEADACGWLDGPGVSAFDYSVSGFGIENPVSIPLLDQTFGWDQPLMLVRIRGQRKLDELKYENVDGPANGLLIWVRRNAAQDGTSR